MRLVNALRVAVVSAVPVIVALPAAAQTIDTVRFWTAASFDGMTGRVRQTGLAASAWSRGTIHQSGPVVVLDTAPAIPMTVAHGQPVEIQVLVGRRRVMGLLIGTLVGSALSVHALTTCRNGRSCAYCSNDGCDFMILTPPLFIGTGAAFGTLFGWGIPHWEPLR